MNCWICGAQADSREHLLKASDLRHFFGSISPSSPVFYHSDHRRNVPLHSAKSSKVKTGKVLCQRCNDTRTAPYDLAWERLLKNLSNSWKDIKKLRRFKLQRVFPGATNTQSANVHLYFVKLFGCRIVDEEMPIDIAPFADAINKNTPHDDVYLTFTCRTILTSPRLYAGVSGVHAKEYSGAVEMATWYYSLGELDIQVTWFRSAPIKNIPYAWHPTSGGKILKFRNR